MHADDHSQRAFGLETRGISKDYAVRVLDQVDFGVRAGEIHALLGANGAGKSTLCRILAGLIAPTSGTMVLEGQRYAPSSKQSAEHSGVQIVQQELNLFPTLTVAENLLFGRFPQTAGIVNRLELDRRARIALERVGLTDVSPDTPLGSLGVGKQQMVEIATALDRDCRVLILDEPTAALSVRETATLFNWLARLRGQGVGIVYISHRLEEVLKIADRATILRDGKQVATEPIENLTTNRVVALMSGDNATHGAAAEHQDHSRGEIKLSVARLSRDSVVRDVSFQVQAGQRLGIAGLVGAGRTELLRAMFGADVATSGTIQIGNRPPTRFSHPRQAVCAGIAMVTEDRKQNGLLLPATITDNTTLGCLGRFQSSGVCSHDQERDETADVHQQLETHCTSIDQIVATLSGGNQQKVAIAKWLVRDAEVFLFDEPTRGIDIGARRKIYQLFEALARQGKSLVIVSSDLDELLEATDRILVLSDGQVAGEFDRENWDRESILQACFAGYR